MEVYPILDIRIPEAREGDLILDMKSRATSPWSWQAVNTHGRTPDDGTHYFHRDTSGGDPACAVCIHRRVPGNLVVQNIVPDVMRPRLEIPEYVRILREFDNLIASPAAESVGGITITDTAKRTLEDYFGAEAVRLLNVFCTTSNGYGSHPSDQKKWIAFLLQVHRSKTDIHCDDFGRLLRAEGWWPEGGIDRLVREYDFAMRLLRQAEDKG